MTDEAAQRLSGMVSYLDIIVFLLLFISTSVRLDDPMCGWAVHKCERSDEGSCRVRLRRWCPCALKSRWKCSCKTRKCDDDSILVNISDAREMTKNKIRYATDLETFCDLDNCTTYSQECHNFVFLYKIYGEDSFLQRCCYQDKSRENYFIKAMCSVQLTKNKWCFLKLCGYLPKPTPKPTDPPQPWTTWSSAHDPTESDSEDSSFSSQVDYYFNFHSWILVIVAAGFAVPLFISICFCSQKTANQATAATNRSAISSPSGQPTFERTVAVQEPMLPQPGEPVPLNRLPPNLNAPETVPPLMNINEPE